MDSPLYLQLLPLDLINLVQEYNKIRYEISERKIFISNSPEEHRVSQMKINNFTLNLECCYVLLPKNKYPGSIDKFLVDLDTGKNALLYLNSLIDPSNLFPNRLIWDAKEKTLTVTDIKFIAKDELAQEDTRHIL